MSYVDRVQHSCCIIRVNVADEFCFHLEQTLFLSPVLQSKIHSTRTKVTAADTDLYYCREFFSCGISNLTGMYFIGEFCDLFLLCHIESSFVHTISHNSVTQLSAGQLMKNETVLTGIDHCTIIQLFKFLRKLCFLSQFYQCRQHIVVHLLSCVIVRKSGCHRNAVFLYTLSTILSGHHCRQIYFFHFGKLLVRSQGI